MAVILLTGLLTVTMAVVMSTKLTMIQAPEYPSFSQFFPDSTQMQGRPEEFPDFYYHRFCGEKLIRVERTQNRDS
jgi:hypothetical protein